MSERVNHSATTPAESSGKDPFVLGKPELVCRWRLASGTLPLENRHLRALSQRTVNGAQVTSQLVGWAKQHIEWTLTDGSAKYPDGVLMIVVDDKGQAVMTVGPYEPLPDTTTVALADRARAAAEEAEVTGIAPETLWAYLDKTLVIGAGADARLSGAATLICDLADTVGFSIVRDEALLNQARDKRDASLSEVFLVSDEYGVVRASDAPGPHGKRFADGYAKLLDSASKRATRKR